MMEFLHLPHGLCTSLESCACPKLASWSCRLRKSHSFCSWGCLMYFAKPLPEMLSIRFIFFILYKLSGKRTRQSLSWNSMAFIPGRQYHNYWSMIKISVCLLVSHCFLAPKLIESSCLVLVPSMVTVGSLTGPVSSGGLCQHWVDQCFCDPCRRCWGGEA